MWTLGDAGSCRRLTYKSSLVVVVCVFNMPPWSMETMYLSALQSFRDGAIHIHRSDHRCTRDTQKNAQSCKPQ